jgi:hypothetical protein
MRIAALKFAPESKCPGTSESRRQLVNKRHSRVRGSEGWYYIVDQATEEIVILNVKHPASRREHEDA